MANKQGVKHSLILGNQAFNTQNKPAMQRKAMARTAPCPSPLAGIISHHK